MSERRVNTLNIAGSTTLLPLTQGVAEVYMKKHGGIKINVQGGGSSAGIEAVARGVVDIGTSSRELKEEEKNLGLVDIPVAIDAIAIIVNKSNPVESLNKEQVKAIFAGKITNWKKFGGDDEEILVVNRDEASGTREAFSKLVMGEEEFLRKAVIQSGTGQVRSIISRTPRAIGYISLSYVTKEVKVIKYNGVYPTREAVRKGEYELYRKLHFLTKGKPKGLVKDFIDFVLSSTVQNKIVSREYVPIITP